ncbi:MAG: DUF420 domain-containing protein [Vicinamibacterales bacterium]
MTLSDLPTLNAILNATSAVLLTIGWWHITHHRIAVHRRFMLAACTTSAMFLTSYVIYHAQVGSKPFPGHGIARTIYFLVLVPHVVLAAAIVPMVILTLRRGLMRSDVAHRRIARITLPLWLYVSVTGVIVYLMLYRMY